MRCVRREEAEKQRSENSCNIYCWMGYKEIDGIKVNSVAQKASGITSCNGDGDKQSS